MITVRIKALLQNAEGLWVGAEILVGRQLTDGGGDSQWLEQPYFVASKQALRVKDNGDVMIEDV